MDYKLIVNSNNPPTDALIVADLINSQKNVQIEIVWSATDWKKNENVRFIDKDGNILGENANEVSRYAARTLDVNLYGGTGASERTQVDHWLSFAIAPLGSSTLEKKLLTYLNHILLTNTWLVAKKLTIADISVFCALLEKNYLENYENEYSNITRWYKLMLSLSAVTEALSVVANNKNSVCNGTQMVEPKKQITSRKQEGKFIDLPGAELGKVVVRFPPEASGYLHIGHAKAALLNQYYADAFQGQLIMRFDDTNPAKEDVEFEQAILYDLELLQIKPHRFTHTSDYFDLMLKYCTKLIEEGKAFVDNTPAQVMKEERDQRLPSKYRERSRKDNIKLWNEMQIGSQMGQECCVRVKIDYQSTNGCLRDPTIYRCKVEPHPRTGTKYKVYPTYDFACPIVDAVEDVTHTLRTTEYHDRDAQFYWIIDALKLRRPYIWEYSRLNMTNTVLSKRKLTWFVEQGLVDGWDDPRFPTVRGILRRGMTVEGLKQFIIAQGSSRSVVFMEWDKIWAFNKKVIDPIAHRYTALDHGKTVPVHIMDATEEWLTVQNHPKDLSKGTKKVHVSPHVLIEEDDANALVESQNVTFINWGNLKIESIERSNNTISKVTARLNLQDKNYKNTLKITWLAVSSNNTQNIEDDLIPTYAVYFDHIISKPVLGKDDDFKDFVAPNTRKEIQMLGETELKRVKKGETIQLQRKGFFRCDVPYNPISLHSSREQPLILFHIPDGHVTASTANVTSLSSTKLTETISKDERDIDPKAVNEKIICQGNKIRSMKTDKADKTAIDAAVKVLLSLKAEYKTITGVEWKPGCIKDDLQATSPNSEIINEKIILQGTKIRSMKSDKANKAAIDTEVKILLSLKTEYKAITGAEWKPGCVIKDEVQPASNDPKIINEKIISQGNKIRSMKTDKVNKAAIDAEVKILLSLKTEYKAITGVEWKPGCVIKDDIQPTSNDPKIINEKIIAQGNKIRSMKTNKANKAAIDAEVKILLSLKVAYRTVTGTEWTPETVVHKAVQATNVTHQHLNDEIVLHHKKVDELQAIIKSECTLLSELLEKYKNATGKVWSVGNSTIIEQTVPCTETHSNESDKVTDANKLSGEIQQQGDKIRQLKSTKADKSIIDQEVKALLLLKTHYKTVTGRDWAPSKSDKNNSKVDSVHEKSSVSKKEVPKNKPLKDIDINKSGTRLGLEVKKDENFFEWYCQIITKSGMIEYYDVSGCYILRPWSFAIWKIIKDFIDKEITKLGVQECYFPIFVTRSVLEKEKSHIADFAPEVAWVTKCGESDLAEPIAIRPTSETVMYPAYAKWLKSDTELPLKLNQWNNVVRWEFKDPKPFLRTREFLWQEGHTAFATKAEAEEEVLVILDIYAKVYEDLLAIPVVKGRKTEKEKFAGGDYTTTVEAFISTSGRAIQGATSHHLGQNFSKMFNIQVEGGATEGDDKTFVYQNSWGLTTRTIGVMIMVHGDDKGLVLPPNVAAIQAILVPCGITANTTVQQKELLVSECTKLMDELNKDSALRIKADYRNNRTPGWKFNHWELKGVPVRIELGPKDMEKNQVTFVRRDTSERIAVKRATVLASLRTLLNNIHSDMLARASKDLKEHIKQVETWDNFYTKLNENNLLLAPFCGEPSCEDNIKADSARKDATEELGALSMGAKSLCIPFDQPQLESTVEKIQCIYPTCQNKSTFYTLFGRSY